MNAWKKSPLQLFWNDIAAVDHLVQFYENEHVLLNSMEGFAGAGLIAGDTVVIIAEKTRLSDLTERLENQDFNINQLKKAGKYVALDAEDLINKIMIGDLPDKELFDNEIAAFIMELYRKNSRIRIFGGMVGILWQRYTPEATLMLEKLWDNFHKEHHFTLFHAYPEDDFSNRPAQKNVIACTHSKRISGKPHPSTEIHYI